MRRAGLALLILACLPARAAALSPEPVQLVHGFLEGAAAQPDGSVAVAVGEVTSRAPIVRLLRLTPAGTVTAPQPVLRLPAGHGRAAPTADGALVAASWGGRGFALQRRDASGHIAVRRLAGTRIVSGQVVLDATADGTAAAAWIRAARGHHASLALALRPPGGTFGPPLPVAASPRALDGVIALPGGGALVLFRDGRDRHVGALIRGGRLAPIERLGGAVSDHSVAPDGAALLTLGGASLLVPAGATTLGRPGEVPGGPFATVLGTLGPDDAPALLTQAGDALLLAGDPVPLDPGGALSVATLTDGTPAVASVGPAAEAPVLRVAHRAADGTWEAASSRMLLGHADTLGQHLLLPTADGALATVTELFGFGGAQVQLERFSP